MLLSVLRRWVTVRINDTKVESVPLNFIIMDDVDTHDPNGSRRTRLRPVVLQADVAQA